MAGCVPSPTTGLQARVGGGRGCRRRAANRRMLWSRDSSRHLGPGGQGVQGGAGPPGSWCGGSRLLTRSPGVLMLHGTSCAIEQGVFAGTQPARRRRTQCTLCPGHEQLHPIPSGLIAPRAHGTLCGCWCRWPPAAARVRQGKGRGCQGQRCAHGQHFLSPPLPDLTEPSAPTLLPSTPEAPARGGGLGLRGGGRLGQHKGPPQKPSGRAGLLGVRSVRQDATLSPAWVWH